MKFFQSNTAGYRLLRTLVQAVIGVVIANIDTIIGNITWIPAEWKAVAVAVIMAILSVIMKEIGKDGGNE